MAVISPLAQTFFVNATNYPSGLFLSGLNLFFSAVDSVLPISVGISPVTSTGVPDTTSFLSYSQVTNQASNCYASTDASVPTTFTFPSLVYVPPGEYAIVITTSSVNYQLFIAEVGATQINSTSVITEQPLAGNLFKSMNGTAWTATLDQDLTFQVLTCNFSQSSNTAYARLNSIGVGTGVSTINVTSGGANYSSIPSVTVTPFSNSSYTDTGSGCTAQAVVTSNTVSSIVVLTPGSKYNVPPTITLSGGAPTANATANASLYYVRGDVAKFVYNSSTFANTSVTAKTVQTTYSANVATETSSISVPNNNYYPYTNQRVVTSANNDIILEVDFAGVNPYVSPVLDLSASGVFLYENKVNNVSTNETLSSGGLAAAKYITRKVTLATGMDATDLRVYFDAYKSTADSILVYYKIQAAEDNTPFDSLPWIQMNADPNYTTVPASTSYNDFHEYAFTPSTSPISYTIGTSTFYKYLTFSVKVVFLSSNSSDVPRIKNFRALALA
jgi:hypothetical protein